LKDEVSVETTDQRIDTLRNDESHIRGKITEKTYFHTRILIILIGYGIAGDQCDTGIERSTGHPKKNGYQHPTSDEISESNELFVSSLSHNIRSGMLNHDFDQAESVSDAGIIRDMASDYANAFGYVSPNKRSRWNVGTGGQFSLFWDWLGGFMKL